MTERETVEGANKVPSMDDKETFKTKEEYFAALQKWLTDAYTWHWQSSLSCVPYMVPNAGIGFPGPPLSPGDAVNPPDLVDPIRPPFFPVPPAPVPAATAARTTLAPQGIAAGIRYRVPPMWKRICAELVDSLIMFFLKLIITFIAVQLFSIDFEKFDLDTKFVFDKLQYNVDLPMKIAYEMTSQLLILELINRIFVCILEAYWLRQGEGGRVGGSTPGKSLLGLRVVLCHDVIPVQPVAGQPQEVVVVSPGTDLGWQWALTRSVSKSLMLAFVYPVCFAFFFFQHNRTAYDMLCHSIVVENPQNRQ